MNRVMRLSWCLGILLFSGVIVSGQTPSRPGIPVATSVYTYGHRLLDSWTWGEYADFKMSGTRPEDPRPCYQACDRSLICRAWTMVLKGRAPYKLADDTCFLQVVMEPARPDRCCLTGVRNTPLPAIPETTTGDGESYIANSSYASRSFGTALLAVHATPWACRAACIEQAATAGPGRLKCEYWSFTPPVRTAPPPADRNSRCLYSAAGSPLRRVDGWTAGGPIPR